MSYHGIVPPPPDLKLHFIIQYICFNKNVHFTKQITNNEMDELSAL